MVYIKLLLLVLSMLLITEMISLATARRHGHHGHHRQHSEEMAVDDPLVEHKDPGRGPGPRRFQGNSPIPGFPMKGPPSPPFILPQHRGPHMNFPRDNMNNGQEIPVITPYPITRNYNNNLPIYLNNPFLPGRPQNQGNSGNLPVQQPPQQPIQQPSQQLSQQPPQQPVRPQSHEDLQKLPAIEPVTNELPSTDRYAKTTAKTTTINPREFDLLYGSNLYEENKTKPPLQQQSSQPQAKNAEPEPDSFDDRILIDSAPHCQEGYTLVGNKCRLKA